MASVTLNFPMVFINSFITNSTWNLDRHTIQQQQKTDNQQQKKTNKSTKIGTRYLRKSKQKSLNFRGSTEGHKFYANI